MTMRPDYGMHLLDQGMPHGLLNIFYDFRIDHITVIGPSQFTTMVNIVSDGTEYAMSLDFDNAALVEILDRIPSSSAERILSELDRASAMGRTIELGSFVQIGVKARLCEPVRTRNEYIAPFILEEIFPATGEDAAGSFPTTSASFEHGLPFEDFVQRYNAGEIDVDVRDEVADALLAKFDVGMSRSDRRRFVVGRTLAVVPWIAGLVSLIRGWIIFGVALIGVGVWLVVRNYRSAGHHVLEAALADRQLYDLLIRNDGISISDRDAKE